MSFDHGGYTEPSNERPPHRPGEEKGVFPQKPRLLAVSAMQKTTVSFTYHRCVKVSPVLLFTILADYST